MMNNEFIKAILDLIKIVIHATLVTAFALAIAIYSLENGEGRVFYMIIGGIFLAILLLAESVVYLKYALEYLKVKS